MKIGKIASTAVTIQAPIWRVILFSRNGIVHPIFFLIPNKCYQFVCLSLSLSVQIHLFNPFLDCTEKMESFWPKKVESLVELKFDPGFRGIYTSQNDSILRVNLNWLSISSQFVSNLLRLLGIPGRILVQPVTQSFRSKWLHFSFSVCPQIVFQE